MITRRQILLGGTAAAAVVALTGLSRSAIAQAASGKFEIVKSDEEWRRELTAEQYAVLRRHGTERPWSSSLNNEHRLGTYLCVGCDLPLFSSTTKFESKTGWPSFWAPIERAIGTSEDRSFFSCRAQRSTAAAAEAILDMFSMMVRNRPGCVIA